MLKLKILLKVFGQKNKMNNINKTEINSFIKNFFKQSVNQWLCIALLGLICFWVVLFYIIHKAEAIADNFSDSQIELKVNINNKSKVK